MKCWDQTRQLEYYYNTVTQATQWDIPEDYVSVGDSDEPYKLQDPKLVAALKVKALLGEKSKAISKKSEEEAAGRQAAEDAAAKQKAEEEAAARQAAEDAAAKQKAEEEAAAKKKAEEEAAARQAAEDVAAKQKAEEEAAAKKKAEEEAAAEAEQATDHEGTSVKSNEAATAKKAAEEAAAKKAAEEAAAKKAAEEAAAKKAAEEAAAKKAAEDAAAKIAAQIEKSLPACQARLEEEMKILEALQCQFSSAASIYCFVPRWYRSDEAASRSNDESQHALLPFGAENAGELQLETREQELICSNNGNIFQLCTGLDPECQEKGLTPSSGAMLKALNAALAAGPLYDQLGFSPVMISALFGTTDVLRWLLSAANDAPDMGILQLDKGATASGATALHIAVFRNDVECARMLIEASRDCLASVLSGCIEATKVTSLHLACAVHDTRLQQSLCRELIPKYSAAGLIEDTTAIGLSPLCIAAALGRSAVVEYLLKNGGADPNALCGASDSAIFSAAMAEKHSAKVLQSRSRRSNSVSTQGSRGSYDSLLSELDDPLCLWRVPPAASITALHAALGGVHTSWKCCHSLLDAKASLQTSAELAVPAVPSACARRYVTIAPVVILLLKGDLDKVKTFLEQDPSAVTGPYFDGNTLLHIAALFGDLDAYELLLTTPSWKVDVDAKNDAGLTAHELLQNQFSIDIDLLELRAGYPESFEPFSFDVEERNIRSMFAAQDPTLYGGCSQTHGQFQQLLQDLATFPEAEELFLGLAEDLWSLWNDAGDEGNPEQSATALSKARIFLMTCIVHSVRHEQSIMILIVLSIAGGVRSISQRCAWHHH